MAVLAEAMPPVIGADAPSDPRHGPMARCAQEGLGRNDLDADPVKPVPAGRQVGSTMATLARSDGSRSGEQAGDRAGPPPPLRRARLPLVGARGPRRTEGGPFGRAQGARTPSLLAATASRLLPLALAFLFAFGARAVVDPREMLPDPAQEQRAREIGRGLRCLVCQNQSIDDSNADLARDLRRIVRERITAGDSDEAVVRFITDRYGDYVLLRPPLTAATIGLWAAPAIMLLAGGAIAIAYLRRRRTAAPPDAVPLSSEERARLQQLTAE